MKKPIIAAMAGLAAFLLLAAVSPAFADGSDKTVTLTGKGTCAKCDLKETDKCQTVIQVEKDGKTVNYYVAQNDIAKAFHKNVCQAPEKVTATGTVKKVDGKMELTATKIELVK